jgi:hypothetical protein
VTSAAEGHFAAENAAAPRHFALLRAKLAILAATAGRPIGAAEDEAAAECEILPVVDEGQLSGLRAGMTGPCFANFLFCYLLDVEFHLEDIARARRANDFPRLARKADTLAGAAADVGALRASAAARRLDDACRAGRYRQSGALIHALGQSCTEAEMELRGFLAAQTRQPQGQVWR